MRHRVGKWQLVGTCHRQWPIWQVLLSPGTAHTQTLAVIGPGQICVSKNNGRHSSNKDFPRGQMNGFADNLDFEKIKTWDRLKISTADPLHF